MKFLFFYFLSTFLVQVELEKRKLLDDKIEIFVPKDFKPMSEEMLNFKYKGKGKPKEHPGIDDRQNTSP